jgi:septum site-determining protein MinC
MLDPLFATETMAELSARQGRLADAVAIYRHLVRASGGAAAGSPDEAARVERWTARLAELESGGAETAGSTPPRGADPQLEAEPRGEIARAPVPSAPERASLVVCEPVRSGQIIYAEDRDLIVVASVHSGAQLLADGNIHVYGALKGRAVAGAHGARDAQVFCLALEAELVGVDTGYATSDDIPPDLCGGPARVFLTPEGTCGFAALLTGKRSAAPSAHSARRLF